MPRVKEKEIDFAKVKRLLLGYEITAKTLSEVLGCSQPTARKKLNSPETLTLGELKKISQRKHIPIDEIRESIQIGV